jgi:hypothetical protein
VIPFLLPVNAVPVDAASEIIDPLTIKRGSS